MHSEYQFPEQPEQGDVPVEVSDPSGPPVPVEEAISWTGIAVAAISFVACSGIAFVLLGNLSRPTMGSTRSSKLQWEQRRAEVDQAIEEELSRRQAEADRAAKLEPDRSDE